MFKLYVIGSVWTVHLCMAFNVYICENHPHTVINFSYLTKFPLRNTSNVKHILSIFATLFTLATVLLSAVIAKLTFLLIAAAAGSNKRTFPICSNANTIGAYSNNAISIDNIHVVKWTWALFICLCTPEALSFVRCLHNVCFSRIKKPSATKFLTIFTTETVHAIGVGLFTFKILPETDSVSGAMLTSSICLIPAVFSLLSRKPNRMAVALVAVDILAIAAQSTGLWISSVSGPTVGNTEESPSSVKFDHRLGDSSSNELSRNSHSHWLIPLAVLACSITWWENFVRHGSVFPFVRMLAQSERKSYRSRQKIYLVVSVWKCLIYLASLFIFVTNRINLNELKDADPFGPKPVRVTIWRPSDKINVGGGDMQNINITDWDRLFESTKRPIEEENGMENVLAPTVIDASDLVGNFAFQPHKNRSRRQIIQEYERVERIFHTSPYDSLVIALVQVVASLVCYQSAKFACQIMVQEAAFALPLNACVPISIILLISFCQSRSLDPCFLTGILPYELFWQCNGRLGSFSLFFSSPKSWLWIGLLLSQFWITFYLWFPKAERLATTEKLFLRPFYDAIFVDQSLVLNRRQDDVRKIRTQEIDFENDESSSCSIYEVIASSKPASKVFDFRPKAIIPDGPPCKTDATTKTHCNALHPIAEYTTDNIAKIYACATMWHETQTEMICMLKSIFRLDADQCARRNAQKYLKVVAPDYYEFDAHIMFDDAFETNEYGEVILNRFFRQFMDSVDLAASAVHGIPVIVRTPKMYSTPYGGKFVWWLPGKNKLVVHLKNRSMIRVRKRWSQVMYMYYLLGHRIMEKVDDLKRKELLAERTFILTLDGDVDFQPQAVRLLVDLMTKNRHLGAACGRIHPRGSGPMAAEHMIGCVLCAPGCFSLFRAKALMDDNVLKKYATKADRAIENIQYDQGEDRWLCTLLLQRGYRVEYCAASDALTFAPDNFDEFFNQRRRWIPSTLANIIHLLRNFKHVVSANDNISIWYIMYQFAMLISSILGPGTIFLMIVRALNISLSTETYISFFIVFIPVTAFVCACLCYESETQLMLARILGTFFALLMMAVVVGTAMQIIKDGTSSPHAIFLFIVIISFFLAAVLHPQEFGCIIPGLLYFLAIPCMYMLLSIYSLCNLHVISWGTREICKIEENKWTSKTNDDHLQASNGFCSMGCGNLFKLFCCLQHTLSENSSVFAPVISRLDELQKKVKKIEENLHNLDTNELYSEIRQEEKLQSKQDNFLEDEEDPEDQDDFNLANYAPPDQEKLKSWMMEKSLKNVQPDSLDPDEQRFWASLIEKYLYPLSFDDDYKRRISEDLIHLRNKSCFAFLMLNGLFVIVILLLQMKKDCLHLEWPWGPLMNKTRTPCKVEDSARSMDPNSPESWTLTRLQLEPIGLVFLGFFLSLLLVQFGAMLMHRFDTIRHILASTEVLGLCKKQTRQKKNKLNQCEYAEKAVELARHMQSMKEVCLDGSEPGSPEKPQKESVEVPVVKETVLQSVSRRRVVKNLEVGRKNVWRLSGAETLDAAFRRRFMAAVSSVKNSGSCEGLGQFHQSSPVLSSRPSFTSSESRENPLRKTLDPKRTSKQGQSFDSLQRSEEDQATIGSAKINRPQVNVQNGSPIV